MIQKKAKPSASDLYASAWAALEAESEVADEAKLREEGWRTTHDFSGTKGRTIYQRMLRSSAIERQTVRVSRPGGIRRVTFFRPKL